MQLVRGDLWESELGKADLILFTANSTLDSRGCLVMGAGSALEAKRRNATIPKRLGEILTYAKMDGGEFLLWVPDEERLVTNEHRTHIGALQTKTDWREPSSLALIERSIERLRWLLIMRPKTYRVAMPLPGCGNGQLRREDVLPLLEGLPDSVFVYERG